MVIDPQVKPGPLLKFKCSAVTVQTFAGAVLVSVGIGLVIGGGFGVGSLARLGWGRALVKVQAIDKMTSKIKENVFFIHASCSRIKIAAA